MLNDSALFDLNSLVQRALDAGTKPKKVLELLDEALNTGPYVVSREELNFDSYAAKRSIPDHVMVASHSTSRMPLKWVFRHLSGSGSHYNGMWGDGSMLRDPEAAATLKSGDRPAEWICEQVVHCVRLLCSSTTSLPPKVAAATRRHLSQLMLQYPVLLHPAFMVPAELADSQRPEVGSLLYILSKTPHGGLPRYSHFEPDDGLTPLEKMPNQALVARLKAFAKHPCVQLALTRAPMRVCLNTAGDQVLVGKGNILEAMTGVMGPRVQFIASVMETEELANPHGPNTTPALPLWSLVPKSKTGPQEDDKTAKELMVISTLARATMTASGLVHLVGKLGTLPDEMRIHEKDARLHACVRSRMPVLCGLDKEGSKFGQRLADSMYLRVFTRQQGMSVEELVQNTTCMAQGLVDCGFACSLGEASAFIAQVTLGHGRHGSNLPSTQTAGAVAFIKAIDEMGGFGSDADSAVDGMRRLAGAVRDFPAQDVPYRSDWDAAFRAVVMEKTMVNAMAQGVVRGVAAEASNDAPPALARRARAAL